MIESLKLLTRQMPSNILSMFMHIRGHLQLIINYSHIYVRTVELK